MAGDWIKMRDNLWDDPRVSRMVDRTGTKEATVIGGLYWLWTSADQHSETGLLPGLSVTAIDRKTGIKGLGAALIGVGWIAEVDEGVQLIRFDEHNGASAKRRAIDAKRKGGKSPPARASPSKIPLHERNKSGRVAEESRTNSGRISELDLDVDIREELLPAAADPLPLVAGKNPPPPPSNGEPERTKQIVAALQANRCAVDLTCVETWVTDHVTDAVLAQALGEARERRRRDGSDQPLNTGFVDGFVRDLTSRTPTYDHDAL